LDRIDVFAEVPPFECERLVDEGLAEDSSGARHRAASCARRPGVAKAEGFAVRGSVSL
jgi:hypothetical protein